MKIANYMFGSTVDGPGVRNVLFVQGCRHNCKGCHNPQTHSFDGGKDVPYREIVSNLVAGYFPTEKPLITISGGDPFYQPMMLGELVKMLKVWHNADIWVYTGFLWEQVKNRYGIMKNIDVLVDGPYVEELKTLEIPYVGSSNQRKIDVQKSLVSGKMELWEQRHDGELEMMEGVL